MEAGGQESFELSSTGITAEALKKGKQTVQYLLVPSS